MARFFGKVTTINAEYYTIEDILLKRYGSSIDYILNKDIDLGFENIKIAIKKEQEEKLWDLYIAKSILADKNYPEWETVLKDSKKAVRESKPKTNDFKKKVETARKIFKK